jgi:hypothetical protein
LTPAELRRRAAEAERLTREPLLMEALAELEAESIEEIVNLPLWRSFRRRMCAVITLRVIRNFREHLASTIRAGDRTEPRGRA